MGSRTRLHVLTAALLLGAAGPARARLLLSQKQALALAFPSGKYERKVAYLNEAQVKRIQEDGQVKLDSKVWPYYVGKSSAGLVYAYFDTHVVRTLTETFMAVAGEDGTLRSIELLAFNEPDDYLPSPRWLAQFKDKKSRDDLYVGRAIRNITGASLSSQAMTQAVRRVLAVHRVLLESAKPK